VASQNRFLRRARAQAPPSFRHPAHPLLGRQIPGAREPGHGIQSMPRDVWQPTAHKRLCSPPGRVRASCEASALVRAMDAPVLSPPFPWLVLLTHGRLIPGHASRSHPRPDDRCKVWRQGRSSLRPRFSASRLLPARPLVPCGSRWQPIHSSMRRLDRGWHPCRHRRHQTLLQHRP
jgi:hypothetical protein